MVRSLPGRISARWSTWFTAAVIAWFAFAATGIPDQFGSDDHSSDSSESGASTKTTTTSDTVAKNAVGPLEFKVAGFRIEADNSTLSKLAAEVTLDIKNRTGNNLDFRSDQIVLRRIGGGSVGPTTEPSRFTVASRSSQIVPLTFPVDVRPGASYELTYRGLPIYTGRPF